MSRFATAMLIGLSYSLLCLPANAGSKYTSVSIYATGQAFSEYEICSATIATIFSRPVKIMKVKTDDEKIYYIKYTRPSDNSIWINKCKIDGFRVIWGASDGRWREDRADSFITYEGSNGVLTVTEVYSDGSKKQEIFSKAAFR